MRALGQQQLAWVLLKIAAVTAVFLGAPFFWLSLVEGVLYPQGSATPPPVLNEYFAGYFLTLLSVLVVPFLRAALLRIFFGVLMLLSIAFDQAIQAISGAHVNQELINLMWQARANASDSFSYFGEVFWHVVWLLPVSVVFFLDPRRVSLGMPFALIPIVAMGVEFHNVQVGHYHKVVQPPVFAIEGQIMRAFWTADPRTSPVRTINYAGKIAPRIRKIVFIVDESIGGSFISLNNPEFDNTPFLASLQGKAYFFNFGIASSIANCSTASRLMLRVGLRRSTLPDTKHLSLKAPNFWSWAEEAGFRTVHIDAFRTLLTYHSFMGNNEASQVNERIGLEVVGTDQSRDHDIARRVLQLLDRPEPEFIFVEKLGTHYPHSGWVLPQDFRYRPKGAEKYADKLHLNSDQRIQVTNYLKEINWQVDEFFKILRPALERDDTVVVYTSDHGQNMFESVGKLFHCNTDDPVKAEAEVPLILATGNRDIARDVAATIGQHRDRSSHYEIFPSLLDWMGYDRNFAISHFGPELYGDPPVAPRRFAARDHFNGKLFAIDDGALPDDDNLLGEAWTAWPGKRNVAKSKEDITAAPFCSFDVRLGPNQSLGLRVREPVAKGAALTAGLWLWSNTDTVLTLAVTPDASGTPGPDSITLGQAPAYFQASHAFGDNQLAWRLVMTNPGSKPIDFKACQARAARNRSDGRLAAVIRAEEVKAQ